MGSCKEEKKEKGTEIGLPRRPDSSTTTSTPSTDPPIHSGAPGDSSERLTADFIFPPKSTLFIVEEKNEKGTEIGLPRRPDSSTTTSTSPIDPPIHSGASGDSSVRLTADFIFPPKSTLFIVEE